MRRLLPGQDLAVFGFPSFSHPETMVTAVQFMLRHCSYPPGIPPVVEDLGEVCGVRMFLAHPLGDEEAGNVFAFVGGDDGR